MRKTLQTNSTPPRLSIQGARQGAEQMLKRLFTEHPASVGESYAEHLVAASGFAGRMFIASLACFLHALLPFLCVKTGSRAIAELNDRMVANRVRHDRRPAPSGGLAAR
jgi:hypothetical protein